MELARFRELVDKEKSRDSIAKKMTDNLAENSGCPIDIEEAEEKASEDVVEQAMKECELTIGMTVKEAVEKQIPKKVMLSKEYPLYELCPNCGKNLFSFANGWQYNYCPYCGQALDWGE